MIAFFRRLLRLGLRVVSHELGVVLIGIAAQEAVIALEAPAEQPPIVGARSRHRFLRREMPLPDGIRVVAVFLEDLRQVAVLERNVAVRAGISGRAVRQAGEVVGMMVPPGDDARARRRTERGRVHVVVAEAICGKCVDVRRFDWAAVAAEVPEARIVQHDEEHVGRTLLRPVRRRPGRLRDVHGPPDDAGKRRAAFVLGDGHGLVLLDGGSSALARAPVLTV